MTGVRVKRDGSVRCVRHRHNCYAKGYERVVAFAMTERHLQMCTGIDAPRQVNERSLHVASCQNELVTSQRGQSALCEEWIVCGMDGGQFFVPDR